MSRVAKNPVIIPSGVEVTISESEIKVKGSKGELSQALHSEVEVKQAEATEGETKQNIVTFKARNQGQISRANSGTLRALVNNMVQGVSQGFERQLELVGVGYRAQVKGNVIALTLGKSHPENYPLPEGITAQTPSATTLVLQGIDNQKLGQVAAEIRDLRSPEPYKGKGIRYANERIVRKETKKK